jgi:hypothetical protein
MVVDEWMGGEAAAEPSKPRPRNAELAEEPRHLPRLPSFSNQTTNGPKCGERI